MRAWPLLLLGILGCRGAAPRVEPAPPQLPRAAPLQLPADWKTMPETDFESWVLAALPEDRATPLDKPGLEQLAAALDAMDRTSVRAAVVLGRSRYPGSAAILIRRLEARDLGPARYSDCGDTLAAAALARYPDPRRFVQRLVPLAAGSRPHPDLEVRVECAASALYAGYEQVIPFLLQVLRIDTPRGREDVRDFAVSPTSAWARGRAAEALSAFAGVPLTYRVEGSLEHRQAEAARLEALLLPPPQAPGEGAAQAAGSSTRGEP